MNVVIERYESFDCFFNEIIVKPNSIVLSPKNSFIFRGESTGKYSLLPSALRNENKCFFKQQGYTDKQSNGSYKQVDDLEKSQVGEEYRLLKRFFFCADLNGLRIPNVELMRRNFSSDTDHIDEIIEHLIEMTSGDLSKRKWLSPDIVELAALAQHYGLPTRLIDWTFDIFVALYFAAFGARKRHLADKNTDESDTLVIWALNRQALAYQSKTGKIPLKFTVPPYHGNSNLYAQKGILTYWEVDVDHSWIMSNDGSAMNNSKKTNREPLDKLITSISVNGKNTTLLYKFEILASEWHNILSCILKFGYSTSRLFPGFSGVVSEVKEQ